MSFIVGILTGGLFVGACAYVWIEEYKKTLKVENETNLARLRREIVIDLIKKGREANGRRSTDG